MKRKITLLPFIIIGCILFALNWFILSGIHVISHNPVITPVFWCTVLLITGSLIFAIVRMRDNGMDILFKIATHAFLILFVAELIASFFLIAGDIYRLIAGVPRSVYWIEFCIAIFAFTVLIFLYGIVRGKYAYRVIRHTLYFDDLPENFDGFTISQISDIHSGSFKNPSAVQKGIDLVNKQQSDLFVFTGDLVNNKAEEIQPWITRFSQIKA
ncbi:MAG TPA: metallophosphoesterase, partial [Pedobacter sp.]|nr:metallophosphoesterase [Pedobacter sp.]